MLSMHSAPHWYSYFITRMFASIRSNACALARAIFTRSQSLLQSHEILPPKPGLLLARGYEEREVAKSLDASLRRTSEEGLMDADAVKSQSGNLMDWIARTETVESKMGLVERSAVRSPYLLTDWPEPINCAESRRRLENELSNLDALCAPHSQIHQALRSTQHSLRLNNSIRSRGYQVQRFAFCSLRNQTCFRVVFIEYGVCRWDFGVRVGGKKLVHTLVYYNNLCTDEYLGLGATVLQKSIGGVCDR